MPNENVTSVGNTILDGNDIGTVFHEFAHIAMCPPERRVKEDFGLGPGHSTSHWLPKAVSRTVAKSEEEKASALGIHLLWKAGLRHRACEDYRDHGWDIQQSDNPSFRAVLKRAYRTVKMRNRDTQLLSVVHNPQVFDITRLVARFALTPLQARSNMQQCNTLQEAALTLNVLLKSHLIGERNQEFLRWFPSHKDYKRALKDAQGNIRNQNTISVSHL